MPINYDAKNCKLTPEERGRILGEGINAAFAEWEKRKASGTLGPRALVFERDLSDRENIVVSNRERKQP